MVGIWDGDYLIHETLKILFQLFVRFLGGLLRAAVAVAGVGLTSGRVQGRSVPRCSRNLSERAGPGSSTIGGSAG